MSNNFYQKIAREVSANNPMQNNAGFYHSVNDDPVSDLEREYAAIGQKMKEQNPVPKIDEDMKRRIDQANKKDGEEITFWNLLDFENWGKRYAAANEYAGKQTELSHLNTLWFQKKISNEQMARREELEKELEAYQRVTANYGTVESMFTRGAVNLAHQVWDYTTHGAEKGAKYATAGLGAAGVLASTGVGTPASLGTAAAAVGYGFTAGAAEYAFEQGTGDIFSALMGQKDKDGNTIDEETARTLATLGGAGSAVLEMAGTLLGVKTVAPGISKAMAGKIAKALQIEGVQKILGANATKEITKNLGVQAVVQTAKNYAIGTGGEIATELGQEALTFGVEELGRAIQGGVYDDVHNFDELVERLKETAYETFITVGGVYGVGSGIKGVRHYREAVRRKEENRKALELLAKTVQNEAVKKYPYTAQEQLRKSFEEGNDTDKRYTYFQAQNIINTLFQDDDGLKVARELGLDNESLREALENDIPVSVETEKAATLLYANDKYKHLADAASFDIDMEQADNGINENVDENTLQAAEQAEQLADEAVNLAVGDVNIDELEMLSDSMIERLMDTGLTEDKARHHANIWAAHAQIMAPIWGEKPQDFLDRLSITAEQTYDGKTTLNYSLEKRNVYGQPVNDDVNVDTPVEVVTIEPSFTGRDVGEFTKNQEIAKFKEKLRGTYKNKQTGWDIELTGRGIKHSLNSVISRGLGGIEHIEAVENLPALIENAVLIESHEDRKEQGLKAVHRMYTPMRINNSIFTVKLTVKEYDKGMKASIDEIRRQYDVSLEKKMPDGANVHPHTPSETARSVYSTSGIYELTIRKMLEGVKDHTKENFFINEDGTVNYKQKGDTSNTLYQLAYHGTPHNFDEFSLGNIGSGEGHQAHGWGLYFAKDKATSEGYRENLTGKYLFSYKGVRSEHMQQTSPELLEIRNILKDFYDGKYSSVAEAYDGKIREHENIIADEQAAEWEKEISQDSLNALRDIDIQQLELDNGQLFEVDIPENDVLLDEDLPFNEQPEKVKKMLEQLLHDKKFNEYLDEEQTIEDFAEQELDDWKQVFSGGNIYDRIADLLDSKEEASKLLNQYGIKGITYDGRRDGRCFVVFDDKAISILEKYYQQQNETRLAEEKLQEDLAAWDKTVDKFEKGELNPRQSVTMLNNTPLVLSLLGADKNLTVSTNYRTLNKILHDKHKLPVDVMKQVPRAMTDPIIIFKSATVANDYVMMLDLKDENGATVVVPVSLNYDGIGGYKVNYVLSVYGKANEETGIPNNQWFINQIEQGNLVYQNKQKSREWLKSSRLQLPRVGLDPFNGKNKNILTENDLSRAKQANPTYYQNASPRGLIRFNPKTQQAMITVFKDKQNLSTVLHETGHYFLNNLSAAYQMENVPQWVKTSFETLAKEMNFDPKEPLSTETHERFARLAEAYFREGKAPREELTGAFHAFKGWLTSLYRYVSKLLGKDNLNDEIRGVFDRLLATEEQIAKAKRKAERQDSIQTLSKIFDLTPEQLALLQNEKENADKKAAAVILLEKVNGIKEAEDTARQEVQELIANNEFYKAIEKLQKQKVNFESLLGFLEEDTANRIREKWQGVFADNETALSLDDAAGYYNTSAENLINLFLNELPAKEYEERYIQKARDNFEAAFNADIEYMALNNDVLNLEVELLGGQKINMKALDKALAERADRKSGDMLERDYVKLVKTLEKKNARLQEKLAEKESELQETKDRNKEKAAELRNKKKEEILKLKEEMRMLRANLKAHYERKMEREKTVRSVRKTVKSKTIPDDYREQILQFVQKIQGLGTASMTARMDTVSWQEFKKAKEAGNTDLGFSMILPPVPEWLENMNSPIKLSDLSTADLKDLRTAIKSLAHIGRNENKIIDGLERKSVQETVSECTAPMGKITQKKAMTDKEKESWLGGIKQFVSGALSSMSILRYKMMKADGHTKEGKGPNSKYITQKIQDAQNEELFLNDKFSKAFSAIWQHIAAKSDFTKEFIIEGINLPQKVRERWGGKFSKDRVIAVALNMGNKGNLDALMSGYGWTMEDLQTIVSTLSEEELYAVQQTWDMLEELRPYLEKTYKEINGVSMQLVEAQSVVFTSKEGQQIELRGGYYPLQFDPDLAPEPNAKTQIENILNANAYLPTKPTVRKGMTIARTGSKKAPYLSFNRVIGRHLQDSIKYATHAQRVSDVYKIVSNPAYSDSFISAFGKEEYDQIVPWLKAVATVDRSPSDSYDKLTSYLTSRGSLYAMGLSLRTAFMQFTSIGSSIKTVGLGGFMNGTWLFMSKRGKLYDEIIAKSAFMKNRAKTFDKTVSDTLAKFNPNAAALRVGNKIITRQAYSNACFALTAMADAAVAFPTWIGKYEAEIRKGTAEADAVRLADDAVILAQGSGMTMDTTALMRKKGPMSFMLMFMSFAMNWQNRQRYYIGGYMDYLKGKQSEIDSKEFFLHVALEWVMPVALTIAMKSLQDDEYDMEKVKEDLIGESLSYWLMGWPIGRALFSTATFGKDFGSSTAGTGFEQIIKGAKGVYRGYNGKNSEEQAYNTMKYIINGLGFFMGVPTNSFFRTYEGTTEWLEGDAGIGAIILGKPYR